MQGHKVVFQIEVCKILAVKQLRGQLLQAAVGQVDGVHPLGRNLTETRRSGAEGCRRAHIVPEDAQLQGTFEAVRCQRRCSVYES